MKILINDLKEKKKVMLIVFLVAIFCSHAQKKSIEISYKRNSDKSVDFYYKKPVPGSFYLNLKFIKLSNCLSFGFSGFISSDSGLFLTLSPQDKKKGIRFGYKTSFVRGASNSKIDSLFVYTLPFKTGKKIGVTQNSNVGEKYLDDKKPTNWKSYSSPRINPDTIYAMRKGVVINIKNEFKTDTTFNKSYSSKRNSIVVEHNDGTYAEYKNLKKNSFFVKLGQTIYPQTKLGIVDKIRNSKFGHSLVFSVYYYSSSLKQRKKQTVLNRKSTRVYLTPYFNTSDGVVNLEHKKTYFVSFSEKELMLEFTKKEKRKYIKNPILFQ